MKTPTYSREIERKTAQVIAAAETFVLEQTVTPGQRLVTGVTTASLFRLMAQSRLAHYISPDIANAVGIMLAILTVLLSCLGVIGDLRAARLRNKNAV